MEIKNLYEPFKVEYPEAQEMSATLREHSGNTGEEVLLNFASMCKAESCKGIGLEVYISEL